MKTTPLRLLGYPAATIAIGTLCGAAVAQQSEQVQVQATRTVNAELAGRTRYGVPIVDVSLGRMI